MENSSGILPNALFREIHKNGMLKKYASEKRTGFPRRSERMWAVFCVHDDTEAFLELYNDEKCAVSHKPEFHVALRNVLHISPSICGGSEEHEFAVTLPTQVIRLTAATWDLMMEWVDTIRNKLRELRVLAPKENVYSKMPESKPCLLLPTRDPTSPLPLPPEGSRSDLVPGVESPVSSSVAGPIVAATHTSHSDSPRLHQTRHQSVQQRRQATDAFEESASLSLLSINAPQAEMVIASNQDVNGSPVTRTPSLTVGNSSDKSTVTEINRSSVVLVNSDSGPLASHSSDNTINEFRTRPPPPLPHYAHAIALPSSSNVTVIEVATSQREPLHYEPLFLPNSLNLSANEEARSKLERVSSSGLIPRVSSRCKRDNRPDEPRPREITTFPVAESGASSPKSSPVVVESQHTSIVRVQSVHEQSPQTFVVQLNPESSVSIVSVESSNNESLSTNTSISSDIPPLTAEFQPAPRSLDVKDIPLIGGHQRRRRRSSSTETSQALPSAAGPMRCLGGPDLIRTASTDVSMSPQNLTLRETQVCQLRREMAHPGGVRLKLRRKDCSGAIALVDIQNSVWVAGWKQKEHPLLYNALHIGDEVISVGETPVRSAAEAQKLLKSGVAAMVQLVVRRLPRGKVLTVQRARLEGRDEVGLILDTASPGEVTVDPGGNAARAGLPLCATTMDGLALTTWTLTEVNGRPLNLFCKTSDVETRLNSVGKELSILVQPSDLIKHMRKQLKSIRSYKDYLLQ